MIFLRKILLVVVVLPTAKGYNLFFSKEGMLERLLVSAALGFSIGCATTSTSSQTNATPSVDTRKQLSVLEANLEKYLSRIQEIHSTFLYAIPTAAQKHGLDEELITTVIRFESHGNSEAISWTGCSGLMQVCASSANGGIKYMCQQDRALGPQECCSHRLTEEEKKKAGDIFWYDTCSKRKKASCVLDDRFYPWKNVDSGTAILKGKIRQYKGYTDQLRLGVAAYNAGEGVINEAIKATGEKDPFWTTVYLKITPAVFRKFSSYDSFSEQQLQRKIDALFGYVLNIDTVYKEYKKRREANGKPLLAVTGRVIL